MAGTSKHLGNGLQKDFQVQKDVPVLNVLEIEQDISLEGRIVPGGDLP